MSKFNPSSQRQSVDQGKKILSAGIYLGRSGMEKDCYWGCYQYEEIFYISLNAWSDSVWEADLEDIKNYCDIPSEEGKSILSNLDKCDQIVEVDLNILLEGIESLNDYVEDVILGKENSNCLEDISYQVVGGNSTGKEYIGGTVRLRVRANIVDWAA